MCTQALARSGMSSIGADEILPLFEYVLVHSAVVNQPIIKRLLSLASKIVPSYLLLIHSLLSFLERYLKEGI